MKVTRGTWRHPKLGLSLYLGMGWLALIVIRPLTSAIPRLALFWLIAGGIAYTTGVLFFVNKRLRYAHFVWHLFVLFGNKLPLSRSACLHELTKVGRKSEVGKRRKCASCAELSTCRRTAPKAFGIISSQLPGIRESWHKFSGISVHGKDRWGGRGARGQAICRCVQKNVRDRPYCRCSNRFR